MYGNTNKYCILIVTMIIIITHQHMQQEEKIYTFVRMYIVHLG